MLASATVTGTYDFRNQITIDRYKILYDKTWTLNPQLKLTEAAGTVTDNQPIAKNIENTLNWVVLLTIVHLQVQLEI